MTTTRKIKDVVGVYTGNFTQVFPGARPIKATVKETARLMEHPLETGAIIVDHRIILPVEIELSMVMQAEDYKNAYRQMKQLYLNSTLLTVQTKSGTYRNQIIREMPHDEDASAFDALMVALKLKQVQFANTQFATLPQAPTNQSTSQRGQVESKPTADTAPLNNLIGAGNASD